MTPRLMPLLFELRRSHRGRCAPPSRLVPGETPASSCADIDHAGDAERVAAGSSGSRLSIDRREQLDDELADRTSRGCRRRRSRCRRRSRTPQPEKFMPLRWNWLIWSRWIVSSPVVGSMPSAMSTSPPRCSTSTVERARAERCRRRAARSCATLRRQRDVERLLIRDVTSTVRSVERAARPCSPGCTAARCCRRSTSTKPIGCRCRLPDAEAAAERWLSSAGEDRRQLVEAVRRDANLRTTFDGLIRWQPPPAMAASLHSAAAYRSFRTRPSRRRRARTRVRLSRVERTNTRSSSRRSRPRARYRSTYHYEGRFRHEGQFRCYSCHLTRRIQRHRADSRP